MLSAIIFVPAFGALLVLALGKDARVSRAIAVATATAELVLTLIVFAVNLHRGVMGYTFVERANWISAFHIQYLVGVDGLSTPLVLLNGLLGLAAVLVSWRVTFRPREYFMWLLMLQTAVMGVFISLDFILFFFFWELELVPTFFLIARWGTGRREYSAMKFFIFTFLGSAFMFAAIIALYFSFPGPERTFDMIQLAGRPMTNLIVPASLIFSGFLIAFAVKLPIFPLHTWLPDAYTDSSTAVSVMLAGVLGKMGGYGLLRVSAGMFHVELARFAPLLVVLAVINVLYGAFIVMRQTDLKRMVAYSSFSHMGFVVLGLASVGAVAGQFNGVGLNGAALQLFSHGVINGLLFVIVGLIYDRTHTRSIPDMGGLARQMPLIAVGLLLAGFGVLGLPTTSGFVAEILVFLGSFPAYAWATGLAVFGVVLAAGYMLWVAERTMFGPSLPRWEFLSKAEYRVNLAEAGAMALLVVPIFVVGIYPRIVTDLFNLGLTPIIRAFGG